MQQKDPVWDASDSGQRTSLSSKVGEETCTSVRSLIHISYSGLFGYGHFAKLPLSKPRFR